jgi:hypothetical protein
MSYKKMFISFSLVLFSSFIYSQKKNYHVKVSNVTSKTADKSSITFVAKDSKTQERVMILLVCIGKVCCSSDLQDGVAKFHVYKGKYDIMIRGFGYKDMVIKNFKIYPTRSYELEVLIDVQEY